MIAEPTPMHDLEALHLRDASNLTSVLSQNPPWVDADPL